MPRTPGKLAELDAAAKGIDSLTADGTFKLNDGLRLVAKLETSSSDSGLMIFEISARIMAGRQRLSNDQWRNRGRKLSTVLREFVKAFPAAGLPPADLVLTCRSSQVATTTIRQL